MMAIAPMFQLTSDDLTTVARLRYGDPRRTGPLPRLWNRLQYFIPDVYYEAAVAKLIGADTAWLDIGCGRDVFPTNARLAEKLAKRCKLLVGIDPDATVAENRIVHVREQCTVEDFKTDLTFDVITLRMVAEHIAAPERALAALARLTKAGGKVVVFTINHLSPVSLAAWLIPFQLHHPIKRLLWKTEEKDTFPVAYQMNSKGRLRRLFEEHGFRESYFAHLSDCRTSFRFPVVHGAELMTWRVLHAFGLVYPENCLLGIYERV